MPAARPVVLVVGGTSGIGLATARRLLTDRGATVVLAARSEEALARAARDLHDEPYAVVVDVADPVSVQRAVDRVVAAHGRLDAVVTTAQVTAYGRVEDVPDDVLSRTVEIGVRGTANLARSVLPVFRAQGGGTLVVVSSLLAHIAVPRMGAYVAAKWGQLGLVRSLQAETRAERGIHVCLVSPGAVDTPIYHQAATYAGSPGSAPPPVISPDRVAHAVVGVLDRPRRHVHAGPVNRLAVLGFRLTPWLYDRVADPLVRLVALRGPRRPSGPGNVLEPRPEAEGGSGGWTLLGRLRDRDGRARWRRTSR